ncbi:DUF2523 domain-containing protein [Xanthomonas citri pv. malvacearum]|uniref:DUF2523 domain-containing protein n=1 Tax=Xanthomonas TaxID=338 RepID=UPI00053A168F|nr:MULTISPECIES: DUF2523 domain-containing protein [Xanthomonas]ASY88981.1 DUF2523 domain-containing protein [Xanthomonas citri pv. malvacearum]ASY88991.1 DUF2523 domain-containing protein [Xanthomonas citri pv. malvacearum]PPT42280.1 DUF2523 domain-containing protein [Xanthomonas arboricola]
MPMIIGALIAALMQALRTYLPGIVGRVLLAFGIGLVTNEIAMPALKSVIQSKLAGAGPIIVAYWDATGLGIMVTMILSAILAVQSHRILLKKLSGS